MEDASRRTLLGQTAKKHAQQLQRSNPALSGKEAELIAAREALASLRARGVDAMSYPEVQAWSQRFLASVSMSTPTAPRDWNHELKQCNFNMTASEITDMLKEAEQQASAKGEEAYYEPEFLAVLHPFIKSPSIATAIPLLETAPFLHSYFVNCSPGGDLYEMRRLLDGR